MRFLDSPTNQNICNTLVSGTFLEELQVALQEQLFAEFKSATPDELLNIQQKAQAAAEAFNLIYEGATRARANSRHQR